MSSLNWQGMWERQWYDNAQAGYITVPEEADQPYCQLVQSLLDRWRLVPNTRPTFPVVMIHSCVSGHAQSWRLGQTLAAMTNVMTRVRLLASSAGLNIFLGGTVRQAHRQAQFVYHGNLYKWMAMGPSDEGRARWFAERTTQPYDFWLEAARLDGTLSFGIDEALEWGVVTELYDEREE